jgi:ParB family chromosome partitioning protein
MARRIRYTTVSKELENIVKPSDIHSSRVSVGMEDMVGVFFYIQVDDLIPFRNQARRDFDQTEINALASSIKEYGIRQPLTVFKNDDGKYEVVSGERRLRAAKIAGLTKVPCIILKDSGGADAISLVENIHRKDLHPIELGAVYKKLLDKNIFATQEMLAEKTSVPKSKISEYIRYTGIPDDIQSYIIGNKITSRDKLRAVVAACESNDYDKVRLLVGILKRNSSAFSVLRIIFDKGNLTFQESGINKLLDAERRELKQYLNNLIEKL